MQESSTKECIEDDVEQRKAVLYIAGGALFLVSVFFFILQTKYPATYDADGYKYIAKLFNETGMQSSQDETRTYFYPWFLSLLIALSNVINIPLAILLFVSQTVFYFYCANRLSTAISIKNRNLGRIIFVLLCTNIFVIPYLCISLTEGIFLSLFLLWLSSFARLEIFLEAPQNISSVKRELGIIAAVAGIILVTRPAGLWICVTTLVLLLMKWKQLYNLLKPLQFTMTLIVVTIAFLTPLIPQVYLNTLIFRTISPLPVNDLANYQIKGGIENLKYGTAISEGPPQMFYPNPFLRDKDLSKLGVSWYFRYPVDATLTVAFKLVGAFDFDYILAYVYHLRPSYRWLTSFLSLSIFSIGLFGVIYATIRKKIVLGSSLLPLICFFFWGLVTMPTALEVRFSLPMLMIFQMYSAYIIMQYIKFDRRKKISLAIIYLFIMSVLLPIGYYVSSLNSALQ